MTRAALAGLGFLLLYALAAAAVAAAAAGLRRAIAWRVFVPLLLLPLLYLAPIWTAGKTLLPADHAFLTLPDAGANPTTVWSDDAAKQFAPWARPARLAWGTGEWPHRFPWSGCGTTLDANGSSSVYSPLTLLGLLLPLPTAFTFWAAARLLLALSGTWLWLRELGISTSASLFAAVAFGLSLAMTAWILFPQTAVLALWPWILFAMERLRDPLARRRAFVLLVAVFALLPLSGHLESAASGSAFAGLYLVCRRVAGDRTPIGPVARAIAGAALLALAVSAFSLLPQVLAILASNRLALTEKPFWDPIVSWLPHGPGSPWTPALLLFPRALGDGIASPLLPGSLGSFPEMAQGYVGILGASFALLFLRPGSPRPASEKALCVPLVAGLGFAAGAWPFAEIESLLPGLNRMLPARFLVWIALAGAAIAAFELDRLAEDLTRRRRAALWPLLLFASGIVLAVALERHLRPLHAVGGGAPSQRKAYLLAGLALLSGAAVVAGAARRPRLFATIGIPLLTLASAVELYRQGIRLTPGSDPQRLYPTTPLIRYLSTQPGPFRVAGARTAFYPNGGVFEGIEDVRTHDPVERRDYVEFLNSTCGYEPSEYYKQLRDFSTPALDFLNVRYLVASELEKPPSEKWKPVYSGRDGTVFENARVLPRLFSPRKIRRAQPGDAAWPSGDDWSEEALVRFKGTMPAASVAAEISDYVESPGRVTFRSRAAGDAVLVASLVNDGGWRARDAETGEPLRVGRANGPFLAIAAPAGDRRIRLDYTTPGFRAGSAVSILGVAAALLAAAIGRPRKSGRAAP